MPEEREQTLEREALDVAQARRHQHVLLGEHAQAVQRALGRGGVGGHATRSGVNRRTAIRPGPCFLELRGDARISTSSPSYGATSWMPTGSPSAVQCSGQRDGGLAGGVEGQGEGGEGGGLEAGDQRVVRIGSEVAERWRRLGQGGREQEVEAALPPRGDAGGCSRAASSSSRAAAAPGRRARALRAPS